MSYEHTLVCDGCSRTIDSGRRTRTIETLVDQNGRFFEIVFVDGQREVREVTEPPYDGDLHLCGDCSTTVTMFYTGESVPDR